MRVVVDIPAAWRRSHPPHLEYEPADGVVVTVSNVEALPENPTLWLRSELARRGAAPSEPTRVTLASGWPALLTETDGLLLLMYEFLEYGAVAVLTAPPAIFAAHRDAVFAVLEGATIDWGEPPPTLARLLQV